MTSSKRNLLDKTVLLDWLRERTIITDTGCWQWQLSTQGGGYAQIRSPLGGTVQLHRLTYAVLVAPLGDGIEVHHRCGNRKCCNPEHLEPLSDLAHKKADPNWVGNRTHCKRGHPLEGDNLSPGRLKAGLRICKICARLRWKAYREKHGDAYREKAAAYMRQRNARIKPRVRSSKYLKVQRVTPAELPVVD